MVHMKQIHEVTVLNKSKCEMFNHLVEYSNVDWSYLVKRYPHQCLNYYCTLPDFTRCFSKTQTFQWKIIKNGGNGTIFTTDYMGYNLVATRFGIENKS